MSTLEIKNLYVTVGDQEIIKGFNLTINQGEVHALMGPNGAGKSTLSNTIMGHPKNVITEGQILLDGEDITNLSVDERSHKGIFGFSVSGGDSRRNDGEFFESGCQC